ncbi:MAG TPA: heparan-alpha-glucosaminide N-acetyltransferase domain-containing protein [Candidatus Dojkabacteria bacterium]|nr:heparan-alpha-glucosaminide N-acetyltransferase domain-containing protein [Candidatus Dojkabacteria bacterium]HQF36882.1 heparan-alpha-glucosaminide N-acetyltransferase domain-containing protein [Candidatus Dojkabacteria bacterium]
MVKNKTTQLIKTIKQKSKELLTNHFKTREGRSTVIDGIRTIAIILMTFVHARIYAYSYVNSNSIIDRISDFGGNVSYTLFLFCFGFGVYKLLDSKKENNKALLRKTLYLFASYLLISFIGYVSLIFEKAHIANISIVEITSNPKFWEWISNDIILIISGKGLVFLTEFLISFPLFLLITLLLKKVLNLIIRSDIYLYTFMFSIYLCGFLLSKSFETQTAGALFWGYKDNHYFPILFYMPIYLLGIRWAHINKHASDKFKLKWLSYTLMAFAIITIVSYKFLSFNRFPPSISFISYSLTITLAIPFTIFLINSIYRFFRESGMKSLRTIKRVKTINFVKKAISFIGQRSLKTFSIHTIFMFLYLILNLPVHTNYGLFIITWLITLISALLI